MVKWKLVFLEYAFNSARAEGGGTEGVGGRERVFLRYNNGVPYKIKYESDERIIEVAAHADPLIMSRPWFDVEYRSKDHTEYDIPRFFDPAGLEAWLRERGVKDLPDCEGLYEKTCEFFDEIKRLDELRKENKLPPEEIRFKCC